MSAYKREIHKQMLRLAKIKNTIFLGQQCWPEDFYQTLEKIPKSKRLEMPVAEELQLGMSIGLALEGYLPISIFQRMDFLPRACDQLVNHLDIIEELSRGMFAPKIIIRTTIGSTQPLDTGLQHSKDLSLGFSKLLKNVKVFVARSPKAIRDSYNFALESKESSIIVEDQNFY